MTVGEEIAHLDALRSAAAELEANFPSTLEDDQDGAANVRGRRRRANG
jgi:hypothetical protein